MSRLATETLNAAWAANTAYFEYTSAVNPRMPKIEIEAFPATLHQIDETKIIPLDLSAAMQTAYPCTGPSLLVTRCRPMPARRRRCFSAFAAAVSP